MYRALLISLLVVLAGCGAPVADGGPGATTDEPTTTDTQTATPTPADGTPDSADAGFTWPDDPPTDRIGWENGYWYNESIAVNQTDGLNDTELEAFVNRTMARVEVIRGLEFEEPVPVEVMTRAEYRNESVFSGEGDTEFDAWNDVVWEALLLVGEDRDISSVFDELYGGAVTGFYSPSEDRIVIVSNADQPTINRNTLAHELLHALQDQQFGIPPAGTTQDTQLARDGLIEGDARLVDTLYAERCEAEWDCVPNPGGGGGSGNFDVGVYLTIYTPYSEGPTFVDDLRQRGGWEAVDAAYDELPVSTEQVLHPERYPDERPLNVTVADRSSSEWSRFDVDQQTDTVGEASLFVSLWRNRAIDRSGLQQNTGAYSPYNYVSGATDGWGGDVVVPYRSDDGETGYVFRIQWDTVADAEQFERVYTRTLLQTRLNARETTVGSGVYVVESGPYADAFRVTRDGDTVTIVNAPTVADLDGVHAAE